MENQQTNPQNFQQTQYQQPPMQQQYQQPQGFQQPPMKVGEWILTMFLVGVPFVGFILLLVWAFGSDTNPNKANWAKARLLIMLIVGILMFFFYLFIFLVIGVSEFEQFM